MEQSSPAPIIYPDLVTSFTETFTPVSFIEESTDILYKEDLRRWFWADQNVNDSTPDPLPDYLDLLKQRDPNYRLRHDWEGNPCLLLRRQEIPLAQCLDDDDPD